MKVVSDLKVAYVAGSGDKVASTLGELGVGVGFLTADDLKNSDLHSYDVILLGVRAYASTSTTAEYL